MHEGLEVAAPNNSALASRVGVCTIESHDRFNVAEARRAEVSGVADLFMILWII